MTYNRGYLAETPEGAQRPMRILLMKLSAVAGRHPRTACRSVGGTAFALTSRGFLLPRLRGARGVCHGGTPPMVLRVFLL